MKTPFWRFYHELTMWRALSEQVTSSLSPSHWKSRLVPRAWLTTVCWWELVGIRYSQMVGFIGTCLDGTVQRYWLRAIFDNTKPVRLRYWVARLILSSHTGFGWYSLKPC